MSKLRNHDGDTLIGLVQWIGRKVRHHDPLNAEDSFKTTRASQSTFRVAISADDPRKVIYTLRDGRRYEFRVREIGSDEEVKRVAVGQ